MSTPWIVIAAGATIETALLPYKLSHLLAHYALRASVALTPAARDFVTLTSLRAITRSPVYHYNRQFDPATSLPMHIQLSKADLLIIYPATPRIISQAAAGQITCPATRLFAFMPKERTVVAPLLHKSLEPRLYRNYFAVLKDIGCTILGGEEHITAWAEVEYAVGTMLGLQKGQPAEQISLEELPAATSRKGEK